MPAPADILQLISANLSQPSSVRHISWSFILGYYAVSALFIIAAKKTSPGIFKKNGIVDVATTFLWVAFAIILIWTLAAQASKYTLTLGSLAEMYIFFVFLFAFLYGLVAWHYPRTLSGVDAETFEAEAQYVLLSIGAQTGTAYGRAQPSHILTEGIAALQSLLGLGFLAVWVALAINRISP